MAQTQRTNENDQWTSFWHKIALNMRFEIFAWALFLIMIGILWLMPEGRVPSGTWLIGTGMILLGLDLTRYLNRIWVTSVSLVLGATALVAGIVEVLFSVQLFFPLLVLAIGVSVILKQLVVKDRSSANGITEMMRWCSQAQEESI